MTEKELRKVIREEVKKIQEASGPLWPTKNLDKKEFYNFWASINLANDRLGDYMDYMNKGKSKDAGFNLSVGLDGLIDINKDIKKMIDLVQKEVKEKNYLNN